MSAPTCLSNSIVELPAEALCAKSSIETNSLTPSLAFARAIAALSPTPLRDVTELLKTQFAYKG